MSKTADEMKTGEASDFDSPWSASEGAWGGDDPGRSATGEAQQAAAGAATGGEAAEQEPGAGESPPARPEAEDFSPAAAEPYSGRQGGDPSAAPARGSSGPDLPAPAEAAEKNKDLPPTEKPMTLMEHLGELRSRLVRCGIAVGLAFMACYGVADDIFAGLMKPLVKALPPESKLIFTALPEAFFVYMQVAFVAAVFLSSPFIFYQIWAFIAPGLYDEEKRHMIPVAACSAIFFLCGAAFCYFSVFPFAFTFFMGFATDIIVPMPSLSEYLGFALKLLIAFGLIFEMPLFTFFLARLGLVTAAKMREVRRYAILAIFIIAAILTPPDVLSQLLMAGPMLVLYELSILIAVMVGKDKKEKEGREDKENEAAEGV